MRAGRRPRRRRERRHDPRVSPVLHPAPRRLARRHSRDARPVHAASMGRTGPGQLGTGVHRHGLSDRSARCSPPRRARVPLLRCRVRSEDVGSPLAERSRGVEEGCRPRAVRPGERWASGRRSVAISASISGAVVHAERHPRPGRGHVGERCLVEVRRRADLDRRRRLGGRLGDPSRRREPSPRIRLGSAACRPRPGSERPRRSRHHRPPDDAPGCSTPVRPPAPWAPGRISPKRFQSLLAVAVVRPS